MKNIKLCLFILMLLAALYLAYDLGNKPYRNLKQAMFNEDFNYLCQEYLILLKR